MEVKLVDRRDGTYSATYTLPLDFKSELLLSILFHGTHIQGSPYHVCMGTLGYVGVASWYQNKQPYEEQWRLMDQACAALPGALPGYCAATWQEYVEGKIKGLPKLVPFPHYVLFTGPGGEGQRDEFHCMKAVGPGRPLDGTFTCDNSHTSPRWAVCVRYVSYKRPQQASSYERVTFVL